jgi:hypothetical protein
VTTVVVGVMVRDRTPEMFADLTSSTYTVSRANGITTLTFDADLDAETVAEIRERMLSRDDADMAVRADIAAKRDAVIAASATVESFEDLVALALAQADLDVALACYALGDQM